MAFLLRCFITWVELECYNARCLSSKLGENWGSEGETMTNVDWLTLQMANNMLVAIAMCALRTPTAGDNINIYAQPLHAIWIFCLCFFAGYRFFYTPLSSRLPSIRSMELSKLQIYTRFTLQPKRNKLNTHETNITFTCIFSKHLRHSCRKRECKSEKRSEKNWRAGFLLILICIQ